jgi:hypothetical protein
MLPSAVSDTAGRLLLELDQAFVEPLIGLYVVGSAVLDDWVEGASDVDFIGVLTSAANPATIAALEAVHAKLQMTDGIYVTVEQLRTAPADAGQAPHAWEGRVWISDDHVIPVWWHSLARSGVPLRGPDPVSLDISIDRQALVDWCRANLRDYWEGWARQGADPTTPTARALTTDWGVAWCVLGVLRLHYSIETGEITSKSAAGRYGLEVMDARWRPLIAQALSLRATPEPTIAPAQTRKLADRRDQVIQLMRLLIDQA